jgi:type II secretory pathway component PulF
MKEEKPVKQFKTEGTSLSTNDKIGIISNMHTMLAAGIPILEVVDSLLEDAKGNPKKILLTMKDDLGQGQHLYYTFSRFPRVFDKVTVNIIKASEEAGTLDITLKDIQETIRKDSEFNDKIKAAMIYPTFILGLFFAVMFVILIVVVPKISTVFTQLNVPLPLPTQIMIYLSNFIMANTLVLIIGVLVAGIGSIYLFKRYKREVVNLLVRAPLVSKLAGQIDLTRFTRSLALLLNAGLTITVALALVEDVVIKNDTRKTIIHCREMVNAGKKFSEGLRDNKKIIPNIIIKIVEAGEKTGSLDKSMQDASEFLDYQVSNSLKTVTALIEPIMLVLVGVLVGGMMAAIIAPMYGLISQVGGSH